MNKIYVEVSDLLEHLLVGKPLTGIGRVILQSLSGLVSEFGEDSVRLLAYDSISHKMREKSSSLLKPLYRNAQEKRLFAKNPLGLSLICQFWKQAKPKSDDVLFHAGNWWWRPPALQAFEKLKATTNARVCIFIHDLIPIVRSEFVAPAHVERFKAGFGTVALVADKLITSSHSAYDDIVNHLKNIGMPSKLVERVPLADEFFPLPELGFHPIHALAHIAQRHKQNHAFSNFTINNKNRPFVLMVGTIENRKNVPMVLENWNSIATKLDGKLPQLVLVGKWGQGAAAMQEFLMRNLNLSGSVHVLNHVSDIQLEQLYRGCEFTIFMSQYEGWGLPVGESLWFGKEVLVPKDFALRPDMPNLKSNATVDEPKFIDQVMEALSARKLNPPPQNQLRTIKQFQHDISDRISSLQS